MDNNSPNSADIMSMLGKFMQRAGVSELNCDISVERNWSGGRANVAIKTSPHRITEEENRDCKRAFGPFELENQYDGRCHVGKAVIGFFLDEDGDRQEVKVDFKLTGAFTCKKIDSENATQADIDRFMEKAKDGLVDMVECTAGEFKEASA